MTGSAALSPACFALSDSSSSSALEVDSPTLPSSQISPLPPSAGLSPPCAQPKVASPPGGALPLQPTLVELGHSTSGFFADLSLASGFSYAFFSFGDSSASASLCHDDAFSALLRCAFSGVASVMVAHVFDLEAGPLGDRLLHRLCQLLLAAFLGGGHILLFMHSASGLWTQRSTRSLFLEARAALTASVWLWVTLSRRAVACVVSRVFWELGWYLSACQFGFYLSMFSSACSMPRYYFFACQVELAFGFSRSAFFGCLGGVASC